MENLFLPVSRAECEARGWDRPDFIYVTGDAYVDHPSFGVAITTLGFARKRNIPQEPVKIFFIAKV